MDRRMVATFSAKGGFGDDVVMDGDEGDWDAFLKLNGFSTAGHDFHGSEGACDGIRVYLADDGRRLVEVSTNGAVCDYILTRTLGDRMSLRVQLAQVMTSAELATIAQQLSFIDQRLER